MKKNKQSKWFQQYVPEDLSSSKIFRFDIEIGEDRVEVDISADLDIDQSVIQQQLEDIPSEFAYWSALYSELKLQTGILDRKIKARRGVLVNEAVKNATEAQVRLTDKQVQAIIERDKTLNELECRLLVAQKNCGKLYYMIESMRMKSDSLRSLAGFARIEASQGH